MRACIALVTAIAAIATGCGGDESTSTSSEPATTPEEAANDLVTRYLEVDTRAEMRALCADAFTDYYLRSQVGACEQSILNAADSVELGQPDVHIQTVDGEDVGSAVYVVTVHGGQLDGRSMRLVLEYSNGRWQIDGAAEQR